MSERNRYRIAGAFVLALILTAFGWAFWDGAGVPSLPVVAQAGIPPRPPAPVLQNYPPQQPVLPLQTEVAPVVNQAAQMQATEVAPPPTAAAQPAKPITKNEVKAAAKPVAPPEVQFDQQGVPAAWSLQLASFKDEANAKRLHQQVQGKGHKAYLIQEGGLHKVLIGPELDKARMERLKAEIKTQFGLAAMVVRYQLPGAK
ncbi:SPOR domain-containing protein [Balneatrix alpica]|uniref:SPOR domain-containing protein n=1 Tax=Balneatrix alpica TaxID=75684 RepID=A0ABV5Z7Y3_9GAMM|nr:SPOR domain-containing protein [Balneatrix alpica]